MSERHGNSEGPTRAFFGRRKGHPLRPRQAALFDTLLPRIALDLTKPAPADLRALFAKPVDEVRLESHGALGHPSHRHFHGGGDMVDLDRLGRSGSFRSG